MKSITPQLVKFAVAAILLTIIFRFCLSYGIEYQNYIIILTSSILYGGLMFSFGWYLGKKDGEYLPIYDVGFRFHFTTFLVHNIISLLWFAFGFESKYEKINVVYLTILIWIPILLFHLYFYLKAQKKSINGLNKDDLFE